MSLVTLPKHFHFEVPGPNATRVGGDKQLMLSKEGTRHHRKWMGGLFSGPLS